MNWVVFAKLFFTVPPAMLMALYVLEFWGKPMNYWILGFMLLVSFLFARSLKYLQYNQFIMSRIVIFCFSLIFFTVFLNTQLIFSLSSYWLTPEESVSLFSFVIAPLLLSAFAVFVCSKFQKVALRDTSEPELT